MFAFMLSSVCRATPHPTHKTPLFDLFSDPSETSIPLHVPLTQKSRVRDLLLWDLATCSPALHIVIHQQHNMSVFAPEVCVSPGQ